MVDNPLQLFNWATLILHNLGNFAIFLNDSLVRLNWICVTLIASFALFCIPPPPPPTDLSPTLFVLTQPVKINWFLKPVFTTT